MSSGFAHEPAYIFVSLYFGSGFGVGYAKNNYFEILWVHFNRESCRRVTYFEDGKIYVDYETGVFGSDPKS